MANELRGLASLGTLRNELRSLASLGTLRKTSKTFVHRSNFNMIDTFY